jgi:hypothetical protein
MRTVVVYDHKADPPLELGRAVLSDDGRVQISGFSRAERQRYQTLGLRDFTAETQEDFENEIERYVTLGDGGKFLDRLLTEFTGSYVRAEELR